MGNQWIDFTRSTGYSATLFCFPYSGGSAQVFLNLPRYFSPAVRIMAFEPPGRGRRFVDTLAGSLEDLVNDAFRDFDDLSGGKPFYFFGHSLGGLTAFVMAERLKSTNLPMPGHLFVSGVRAPNVPRREGNTHDLPFDDFVEKLKEMGGTPQEIMDNREMLEIMVPILKSDFRCYETYRPGEPEPLPCPISALGGSADQFVLPADIEQWSLYTGSRFSSRIFSGGHFFLHTDMKNVCRYIQERTGLKA
ncbi:MAG: putative thioesterase [Spirochaetae bacterium HGW-Spirochaetae-1]|jgi:medium-chain acyl-[acyl-carrier-protein] hydrolase|nr:MAG: putative thioesterase [Spirochaetae bacterium HGW-Spirochaetae-1]